MDINLLEEALADAAKVGKLPRAVIVVDLYGQSADYDRIASLYDAFGVTLIEDATEALGATYGSKACGSFGVMGILSFNGNKIITTSGGGMLVSNNKKYIERARHLATQVRDPFPYYEHSSIGYNYRLSNLLAAIDRAQLENLEKKVTRRREINKFYRDALVDIPGIEFISESSYGRSNYWLTCITIDPALFGARNEDVRLFLEQHNIESRHVWKPMHMQPVFAGCKVFGGGVSEDLFARGLCLPSGSGILNSDLERICGLIRQFHKEHSLR
jgi:pyridoxal phosphate-dependent aminotransferase EpsN